MKEESEIYPTVLSRNYERKVCWHKPLYTEMKKQIDFGKEFFLSSVNGYLKSDFGKESQRIQEIRLEEDQI